MADQIMNFFQHCHQILSSFPQEKPFFFILSLAIVFHQQYSGNIFLQQTEGKHARLMVLQSSSEPQAAQKAVQIRPLSHDSSVPGSPLLPHIHVPPTK